MKRHLLILSVITLSMAAGSAYAQSINLKANVPFDFIVNGRTLPAGTYALRTLQNGSDLALLVQNLESRESMIVLPGRVEGKETSTETKLLFHRYGQSYFLSQVFMEGEAAGRQLPKSHWENEVARIRPSQDVKLAASLK